MVEIWTKAPIRTPSKVSFKIIREGSDLLTDILFPRRYPVCGNIILPKGSLICLGYMAKLSWAWRSVCKKCRKEVLDGTIEYCHDCVRYRRSFDYGLSLINYDNTTSRFMVRVKYNNRREYLDFYSEAVVRKVGKRIRSMDGDALIPAPIHSSCLREGGFSQVEELARHLSDPLGTPVDTSTLKRERGTALQENLDSSDRLENLEQAFAAAALPSVIQKAILIGDIYTAGSTIEACARILREAGVEYAYFVTVFIGHGQ